jgi:hypothetical protein
MDGNKKYFNRMVYKMKFIKWFGTFTSIIGSFLVAGMMPQIGYLFFVLGSLAWLISGIIEKDNALVTLNLVFFIANIFGIINYVL